MLHKKLVKFDNDFLWGASTSAYQVEGAKDVYKRQGIYCLS